MYFVGSEFTVSYYNHLQVLAQVTKLYPTLRPTKNILRVHDHNYTLLVLSVSKGPNLFF
jgi:hypothetical protein